MLLLKYAESARGFMQQLADDGAGLGTEVDQQALWIHECATRSGSSYVRLRERMQPRHNMFKPKEVDCGEERQKAEGKGGWSALGHLVAFGISVSPQLNLSTSQP